MFYDNKWYFIGIDRKRNEATIYSVALVSLTQSLYENTHVEAELEKITIIKLEDLLQKFSINNIKDITDIELMSLLEESGCLIRSENVG